MHAIKTTAIAKLRRHFSLPFNNIFTTNLLIHKAIIDIKSPIKSATYGAGLIPGNCIFASTRHPPGTRYTQQQINKTAQAVIYLSPGKDAGLRQ